MAAYPPETLMSVRPFAHACSGDEVTIGDLERQVFLAIPAEGLDILESLAAGKTVGESARIYEEKYSQKADIDDFLTALASEGFVRAGGDGPAAESVPVAQQRGRFWSLDWISQRTAQRLSSWPVVTLLLLITVGGVALAVDYPSMLPGVLALLFPLGNFAALTVLMMSAAFVGVLLHEVAHLVVARASGVDARIGFGNVVYTIVAQTNMDGMWLVSRRRRYLAFVYGLIFDSACCAVFLGVLWAEGRGWFSLSPAWGRQFVSALVFTYFLRISFQFFFYLRTDMYYVVATAFGARNLMSDTEVFLRNGIARALGQRRRVVDQSAFSGKEKWTIRGYSGLYLLGRVFAVFMLVTVYLPLVYTYLEQLVLLVAGKQPRFGVLDVLVAAVLFLVLTGGGVVIWFYDMWRNRGRKTGSVIERSKAATPGTAAEGMS